MDFLDKIGNIAKNIGDRTNDAIEITKLNAKIASEKNAAAEELNKIGDFYYKKFAGEEPIDTEIQDFCAAAAAHYEAIEQAKAEIERIKRENNPKGNSADNDEARPPEENRNNTGDTAAAEPEKKPDPAPESMVVCPACQALNQEGLRFCTQCGSLLEPEPAKEAGEKPARKCPVCGAEMKDGFVFCGCCGAKIAE